MLDYSQDENWVFLKEYRSDTTDDLVLETKDKKFKLIEYATDGGFWDFSPGIVHIQDLIDLETGIVYDIREFKSKSICDNRLQIVSQFIEKMSVIGSNYIKKTSNTI